MTGVLFTIAITVVLSRIERRRSVKVAKAAASYDIERNLQWIGYVGWQNAHPDESPRDHQFGSFDMFPHYAPTLIEEKPELAGDLLRFNGWVQHARAGMPPGGYTLAEDDIPEITELVRRLRDGFGFRWPYDHLENWATRNYAIR